MEAGGAETRWENGFAMLTISEATGLVTAALYPLEPGVAKSGSTWWSLVFRTILSAAEAGEFKASLESPPAFPMLLGTTRPVTPTARTEINGSSKLRDLPGFCDWLLARGWPVPNGLVNFLPPGLREQYDQGKQRETIKGRAQEKVSIVLWAVVETLADKKGNLRANGEVNISAVIREIERQLERGMGNAEVPRGFAAQSLRDMLDDAKAVYHTHILSN